LLHKNLQARQFWTASAGLHQLKTAHQRGYLHWMGAYCRQLKATMHRWFHQLTKINS